MSHEVPGLDEVMQQVRSGNLFNQASSSGERHPTPVDTSIERNRRPTPVFGQQYRNEELVVQKCLPRDVDDVVEVIKTLERNNIKNALEGNISQEERDILIKRRNSLGRLNAIRTEQSSERGVYLIEVRDRINRISYVYSSSERKNDDYVHEKPTDMEHRAGERTLTELNDYAGNRIIKIDPQGNVSGLYEWQDDIEAPKERGYQALLKEVLKQKKPGLKMEEYQVQILDSTPERSIVNLYKKDSDEIYRFTNQYFKSKKDNSPLATTTVEDVQEEKVYQFVFSEKLGKRTCELRVIGEDGLEVIKKW